MNTIFDSRDTFYHSPFGAVCEETTLYFKIVLPRHLQCSAATLKVWADDNTSTDLLSMFWCGMDDEYHEMWECHYTPCQYGLYWYSFEIDTNEGKKQITKLSDSSKAQYGDGQPWQLTVCTKDFQTPGWLSGGIMYQIFPDRFFASSKKKTSVPSDRELRKDWTGQPYFEPNAQGKVTNSDYFGGDLAGIEEKLDYLQSLGVTCIYLNPIFEAHSNHRYNTADYEKVDPLLGTIRDFHRLCAQMKKRGMRLILDGVFSHTGSDSIYFNKENRYNTKGAYQSKESPYYNWYQFSNWPDKYNSWWGFLSLPEINETDPSYNEFINGEEGIARKWLKAGSSGWRLDVADELPDCFMENLRETVKAEKPDALILGEVWEDASNKESYDHRRKFLLGKQLDSVMNYPFRDAVLGFFTGQSGKKKIEQILTILENYPKQVIRVLMNPIGTHDTERAITILSGEPLNGRNRNWQSVQKLSDSQRQRGIRLMKAVSAMQYTLPGVPCIYYGDEAGVEGYKDPFNRTCYPWGKENKELVKWYQRLGKIRKNCPALKDGEFFPVLSEDCLIAYIRESSNSALFCAFNSSNKEIRVPIEERFRTGKILLHSRIDQENLIVPAESAALIQITKRKQ